MNNSTLCFLLVIMAALGIAFLGNVSSISFTVSSPERSGLTEGWLKIVSGGFNDTNNIGIMNFVDFNGYRYVSVGNSKTGGEIWRTQDGDHWEKVGPDGLGDPNNREILLFVFRGKLYAGTYNHEEGAEIWVSSDGVKFVQVVSGGLGDRDNFGIGIPITFNDKLLIPVQNGGVGSIKDGAEIWVSEDGERFQRGVTGGLGDKSNIVIYFHVCPFEDHRYGGIQAIPFKEYIYLGTYNPTSGGEIWRSRDGVSWEKVIDDGFEDVGNIMIRPELIFRDQLYAVTFNLNGLNVFRSSDGKVWEKVVENGFGYGEYRNIFGVLEEINNTLYLSTFSTPRAGAFQIWKSNDGKNWTQVGRTGFGNENNYGAGISLLSDGFLYVSTINAIDGLEVWKSKDSLNWEMIFKEEAGSETHVGGGIVEFNNHLYMYIYDSKNGIEIWKYLTPLVSITTTQTPTATSSTTTTRTEAVTPTPHTIETTITERPTTTKTMTSTSTQTETASKGLGLVEYAIIGGVIVAAVIVVFVILKLMIWARPLPPPPGFTST